MQQFRRFPLIAVALATGLWLTALALPAQAQEQTAPAPLPGTGGSTDNGLYVLLDFSLGDSANPDTNADFSVDLDWSTSFGMGVGYRAGLLRFEGEFNTHFYRVGSLDLGAASPFPVDDYAGGLQATNLMANLYLDFPTTGSVRPFFGAGYGLAWVEAEYNESVCFIYCFSTQNSVVDSSDRTHAWQGMVGATFGRSDDNIEWFMGYRYYETGDLDFTTTGGTDFRQDGIQDHAFLVGFRFFTN